MPLVTCPDCGKEVSDRAPGCPNCGAPIASTGASTTGLRPQRWIPGVAAVLSLVIPGAGQMYKGQIGAGFAWLIGTIIGYALLVVPGLIVHVICIVNAASGDPTRAGG